MGNIANILAFGKGIKHIFMNGTEVNHLTIGSDTWDAVEDTTVRYHIDTENVLEMKIRQGNSAIEYVPTMPGYSFVGWRLDSEASNDVLASYIVGDSEINLYAVFTKPVKVTYFAVNYEKQEVTKALVYNNGNTDAPEFYIYDPVIPEWTFEGWSVDKVITSDPSIKTLYGVPVDRDMVVYGCYSKNVQLYIRSGSTSSEIVKKRYFNASGNYTNATFTVANPTFDDAEFLGWTEDENGYDVQYDSIVDRQYDSNAIVYALRKIKDITYESVTIGTGWKDSPAKLLYNNEEIVANGSLYESAVYHADNISVTCNAPATGWSFMLRLLDNKYAAQIAPRGSFFHDDYNSANVTNLDTQLTLPGYTGLGIYLGTQYNVGNLNVSGSASLKLVGRVIRG